MKIDTRRWYQRTWLIVTMLGLCLFTLDVLFPLGLVGLYLMWRHARWRRPTKWLATLIVPVPAALLLLTTVLPSTGIGPFSSVGTIGPSCLNGPEQVVAGPADSVYVLDGGHLLRIAPGGRILWQRGANGGGGLAADAQGNVYVNDSAFLAYQNRGSIDKLSSTGILIAHWPADESEPALVDRRGTLYAVNTLDSNSALVRRLSSSSGRILGQWRSPIDGTLVSTHSGALFAFSAFDQPHALDQVAPVTGRVVHHWSLCRGCSSFDALTTDARGDLFAGLTVDGTTPFAIDRLTLKGSLMTVRTINLAQEQVAQLAFDQRGNIYVLRSSYARASSSNTGIDELSPSGSVIGTFRPCHTDQ